MRALQWCFKCEECGDQPEVLIGDGSFFTMQQAFYEGTPITRPAAGGEAPVAAPRHRRDGRRFTSNGDDRKRLRAFSQWLANRGLPRARQQRVFKRVLCDTTLDSTSLAAQLTPAAARGRGAVWCTLEALACRRSALAQGGVQLAGGFSGLRFPQVHRIAAFVYSLGTDSAVCTYVSDAAAGVLTAAKQRHQAAYDRWLSDGMPGGGSAAPRVGALSSAELVDLEDHAPLLHAVLAACQCWVTGFYLWSSEWGAFMDDMLAKSAACYDHPNLGELPTGGGEAAPSCLSNACLQSGVCSGLRRVRARPEFAADPGANPAAGHGEGETRCRDCNKSLPAAGKRTGGVFSWYCRHGVCYSFYVIPTAEGRNEAFSFLYSYFERAPKYVVYDFCCALSEYCLNRAPEFFRNTVFLIDRFHSGNHTACVIFRPVPDG